METHLILPKDARAKIQEELNIQLALAAGEGNTKEIIELLTKGKFGILAEVNYGEPTNNITALFNAVSCNQLESVKTLIANGADVNIPTRAVNPENLDVEGAALVAPPQMFPLYRAVKEGYIEIVRELLKAGANPYAVGAAANFKTPLELAQEKRSGKGWLHDWEMLDILNKACKDKKMSEEALNVVKNNTREEVNKYFSLFYNRHDTKRKQIEEVPEEVPEKTHLSDSVNELSKSAPNSKKPRLDIERDVAGNDSNVNISQSAPESKPKNPKQNK